MQYHVKFPSSEEIPVDVTHLPTGVVRVTVAGKTFDADVVEPPGALNLRLDGRIIDLLMEGASPHVGVVVRGLRFYADVESDRMRAISAALGGRTSGGDGLVVSPMPGRVLKVLVSEGDRVAAGMPLVVVEAMKMENELVSARDGEVSKVFVKPGETVESGALLVEVS